MKYCISTLLAVLLAGCSDKQAVDALNLKVQELQRNTASQAATIETLKSSIELKNDYLEKSKRDLEAEKGKADQLNKSLIEMKEKIKKEVDRFIAIRGMVANTMLSLKTTDNLQGLLMQYTEIDSLLRFPPELPETQPAYSLIQKKVAALKSIIEILSINSAEAQSLEQHAKELSLLNKLTQSAGITIKSEELDRLLSETTERNQVTSVEYLNKAQHICQHILTATDGLTHSLSN